MRRVHGSDFWRKRHLLLTDGAYKCHMHTRSVRFFTRAALKQHLYFVHRDDDEQLLKSQKLHKSIINRFDYECKGTIV